MSSLTRGPSPSSSRRWAAEAVRRSCQPSTGPDGPAGGAIPDDGRFTLTADSDSDDAFGEALDGILDCRDRRVEDLHGILLDPARVRARLITSREARETIRRLGRRRAPSSSWCPDRSRRRVRRDASSQPWLDGLLRRGHDVRARQPEVVQQEVGAPRRSELSETQDTDRYARLAVELCDDGCHCGTQAAGDVGLFGGHDRVGLAGRRDDRLHIEGRDVCGVQDPGCDAFLCQDVRGLEDT